MYESPIEMHVRDLTTELCRSVNDQYFVRLSQAVDFDIDREELIKALSYDRFQYERGYRDGLAEHRWIPASERLPEEREWYLVVFKEIDTGFQLIPRVADYIGKGENEWRVIDEDVFAQAYRDTLECIAWMPLPEQYKAESEEE